MMLVSNELFEKALEVIGDFKEVSLDDLYHDKATLERAVLIKEELNKIGFRFENLDMNQRRLLGFGTYLPEYEIHGLIPLWVFRLLDQDTKLVCPLTEYEEGPEYVKDCDDDVKFGCVAYEFYRGEEEPEEVTKKRPESTDDSDKVEDDSKKHDSEELIQLPPKVVEIEDLVRKHSSSKDELAYQVTLINNLLRTSSLLSEEPITAEMDCDTITRETVMELLKLYGNKGYNVSAELVNSKLLLKVSVPS